MNILKNVKSNKGATLQDVIIALIIIVILRRACYKHVL